MDTDAARTFLKVVEIGGLTRAAEVLGISQPSLSRLVQSLEAEVGDRLLERGRAGLVPTAAGQRFLDGVRPLLRGYDRLLDDVRSGAVGLTGTLRVGIPHSLRTTIAAPFVRRFLQSAPDATLNAQFGVSHEIEQGLVFGQLDLGILISPQTLVPMAVDPIAAEPLFLLAAAGAPFAPPAGQSVGWDALAHVPLILPPRENQLRRRVEQAADRAGLRLNVLAEIGAADVALDFVAEGLAATIHPASLSWQARAAGRIVGAPIADEKVVWAMAQSAHARRGRLLDVSAALLGRLARTAFEDRETGPLAEDRGVN